MARPMSLMIEGWMPSVGSSRIEQLGRRGQRARDGELLLLAAGEVAAAPLQHRLEHREQLEDCAGHAASPAGWRPGPSQVLLHREAREDLAPLRHVADAGSHALVTGARG